MRKAVWLALSFVLLPWSAQAACSGDCSGDGEVTIDEIITGVNIALGAAGVGQCGAFDVNADSEVTIDELLAGVTGSLNGCQSVSQPTPTPTPTATPIVTGPTVTPITRPPSPSGCTGGYARLTFSNASGTNGYKPLTGTADLFKVQGTLLTGTPSGFGATGVTCPASLEPPVRTAELLLSGTKQVPYVGMTIPLKAGYNMDPNALAVVAWLDYRDLNATDPLNGRLWRSQSGSATIDSIDGNRVTYHAVAEMAPAGGPATGTFTLAVSGIVDQVTRP